jgi:hypothetical protein
MSPCLSLLPGCHEVCNFALLCPFDMTLCLITGSERWSQPTMNWNLWNHEPKESFPSLNCFCQVFCHSNGKVTNIETLSHINFMKVFPTTQSISNILPNSSFFVDLIWTCDYLCWRIYFLPLLWDVITRTWAFSVLYTGIWIVPRSNC